MNTQKYAQLLDETLPLAIHGEAEYRRMLGHVEALMAKDDGDLTPEESRMLETLGILVEEYEDRVHPLPKGDPAKMLAHLMQEKGVMRADLAKILPKSRVSEILAGKRAISKTQIKLLAEFFDVPADLLI